MNRERNDLIVLTGVTRGCGRALLDAFHAAGYRVAGCGRSAEAIEALRRSQNPRHRFDPVDVAEDDQVRRWAERVGKELGAPAFLINNAATINPNAPLWQVSAAEFDRVIDVNLKGTANTIRHFVPAMIRAGAGVIVNFSSGWGRTTDAEVAPYCASKWGIEGLTRSLAEELPQGLAAVALNPGIIDTEMLRSCFGSSAAGYPSPAEWAKRAAPFILKLGPRDNGQSLDV